MIFFKKSTLQKNMFKYIALLSSLILLSVGILFTEILYETGMSGVNEFVKQRNIASKNFIEGYFSELYDIVEFLSCFDTVKKGAQLSVEKRKEVLDIYKSFQKTNRYIKYIYSAYTNGSILINDYTPPANYNPVIRPWYQAAVKSYPHIANGVPYKEIKTKEWLISLSKALVDENNRITGVIAIDSSINNVVNLIKEKNQKYISTESFVLKDNGKILISNDKASLYKKFSDISDKRVKFSTDSGYFSCVINGADKIAYYTRIKKLNWVIITCVNTSEIINPVIWQIIGTVFIVAILAICLGWILSDFMSKQFINPIIKIKERIEAIISGNSEKKEHYDYPENEIGEMAQYIEQLTENELYNKNRELQKINKKLAFLSSTDQLTKLFNRHKMNEELSKEWKRSKRYNTLFSLVIFDIDYFKKINDNFGHQAGDAVLSELSRLTKETVRQTDIVSRWGGEEFLILCQETKLKQAVKLAEKILSTVRKHKFSIEKTVTISAGVAEVSEGESIEDILQIADERLYIAKNSGRDKVVFANSSIS